MNDPTGLRKYSVLSDEDLSGYRESITVNADKFDPAENTCVGRLIATIDYWRKRYEDEAERYRMMDEYDRQPLLLRVHELTHVVSEPGCPHCTIPQV